MDSMDKSLEKLSNHHHVHVWLLWTWTRREHDQGCKATDQQWDNFRIAFLPPWWNRKASILFPWLATPKPVPRKDSITCTKNPWIIISRSRTPWIFHLPTRPWWKGTMIPTIVASGWPPRRWMPKTRKRSGILCQANLSRVYWKCEIVWDWTRISSLWVRLFARLDQSLCDTSGQIWTAHSHSVSVPFLDISTWAHK